MCTRGLFGEEIKCATQLLKQLQPGLNESQKALKVHKYTRPTFQSIQYVSTAISFLLIVPCSATSTFCTSCGNREYSSLKFCPEFQIASAAGYFVLHCTTKPQISIAAPKSAHTEYYFYHGIASSGCAAIYRFVLDYEIQSGLESANETTLLVVLASSHPSELCNIKHNFRPY